MQLRANRTAGARQPRGTAEEDSQHRTAWDTPRHNPTKVRRRRVQAWTPHAAGSMGQAAAEDLRHHPPDALTSVDGEPAGGDTDGSSYVAITQRSMCLRPAARHGLEATGSRTPGHNRRPILAWTLQTTSSRSIGTSMPTHRCNSPLSAVAKTSWCKAPRQAAALDARTVDATAGSRQAATAEGGAESDEPDHRTTRPSSRGAVYTIFEDSTLFKDDCPPTRMEESSRPVSRTIGRAWASVWQRVAASEKERWSARRVAVHCAHGSSGKQSSGLNVAGPGYDHSLHSVRRPSHLSSSPPAWVLVSVTISLFRCGRQHWPIRRNSLLNVFTCAGPLFLFYFISQRAWRPLAHQRLSRTGPLTAPPAPVRRSHRRVASTATVVGVEASGHFA